MVKQPCGFSLKTKFLYSQISPLEMFQLPQRSGLGTRSVQKKHVTFFWHRNNYMEKKTYLRYRYYSRYCKNQKNQKSATLKDDESVIKYGCAKRLHQPKIVKKLELVTSQVLFKYSFGWSFIQIHPLGYALHHRSNNSERPHAAAWASHLPVQFAWPGKAATAQWNRMG